MKSIINHEFEEHLKISKITFNTLEESTKDAAEVCIECLKTKKKILIFGNGGSASDAQHLAAEIVGRYKTNRKGLAAISLATDTSILTAISNDFGYDNVFSRQIEALANKGDVLIGLSTSGNSKNVINGIKLADQLGCKTIGFSGNSGGELSSLCDVNILIPSTVTARIQEMHIVIGHVICQLIDNAFLEAK
jgi:D-sedoheptulose 7-phosphate isomerase